jgi:hypothetical protein
MDQPASVELAECRRQRDSDPQESFDLHGLPNQAIEGLTPCVLDNQQRAPALAQQLNRSQRPLGGKVITQLVFVRKTIDSLNGRMLGTGRDRYEGVSLAFSAVTPQSAKDAFGTFPEHF